MWYMHTMEYYSSLKRVGDGESVFSGYRVSVWEDGKVPEMEGGDGCTTV